MTNLSVKPEPDVPLVGVVGWFVLLQVVSHVFPEAWRAPWSFGGWVSPVLSTAAWFVGGFSTVAIVMMFVKQERKPLFTMPLELLRVMAGWGLVFFALVAAVHFVSAPNIRAPVVAEAPLKSQIEKLRVRQVKVGVLISDLERDRAAVVTRIREGDARVFGQELLDIDRSLKQ